ncbi:hypothetical protein GRI34_03195 [Erythrobacter aquimaris]|uniref:Uncharacterized protein n=1 Tax=Qipengyuania aquimaris TaxID=255984 RepID=A0A6I4TK90_9SPHN|nr:hypothetical protein [Qipengyuania aquimaris]MXO95421.1 hypothetical protein [Qipengyuania aquimaris]
MLKGSVEANDRPAPVDALFLIFDRDRRPQRSDLIDAISTIQDTSISHDPFERDALHRQAREAGAVRRDGTWLELLKWGMTFDCLGLAPGPKLALPPVRHRLSISSDIDLASQDTIALTPGPHLADASNSIPVVRALLDTAMDLTKALEGVESLCWGPSGSAMSRSVFTSLASSWIEGGPFPALGLIGYYLDREGRLRSDGLQWFLGRELALSPDLSRDRNAATRIAIRLINELMPLGRLDQETRFICDEGEELFVAPAPEHLIEVRKM